MSGRPRALLCDAEPQSVRALRVVLRGAGFEVDETATCQAALARVALRAPEVAITELVLPDGDGVELCRRLREWTAMPVIVVSAVGDEEQKVRALEAGADDYVTKPFGARELVARLHANLRRVRGADPSHLVLHGLEINLATRVVRREGRDIPLTPIEFKLLRVLVQHRGRLLTHSALVQEVWGAAYEADRQTLRGHIANLRRKLGPPEGPPLIGTRHGVGYRFAGPDSEKTPAVHSPQSLALRGRDDRIPGPTGSAKPSRRAA
jgi:two-component system KDP operon response regulator KdpE